MTRCSASPTAACRRDRSRSATPSTASRPAPKWRCCSPTCPRPGHHHRDRRRCAFRPVTRKPILPRFTVGAGANAAGAESDEAAELRRQAEEGLDHLASGFTGFRRVPARRTIAPGSPSTRRHHPHELCGLFPDRRRLHQMGQGRGYSGRPGPRLRRGLAGRLCADHHRSRSDPVWASCSSASSIRNASRCPTSTSTSARTGATR